jgi:hypothetical protein
MRAVGLTGTLLFAAFASTAYAQDSIKLANGKAVKGEIVREDTKNLVYKDEKGKEKELAWSDVASVEYKDFPTEINAAEAAVEARNFGKADTASEEACKATGDGRAKDLFGARARVARARALSGLNKFKEAAQVAEEGIAMGGRWAAQAHIERVSAYAAAGADECIKAGEEAEAKADQFDDEFKYDILLLVGDFYCEVKKDAGKAKEKYAFVQNSRRPELQEDGQLGLARVKLLEKNVEGAESQFRSIAATARSANALCGACLGLGDAVMLKADKGGSKPDLYREAFNFYLRGAVLAQPSGGQRSENHELSLLRAAETAEKIAGTVSVEGKDKNEKNLAAKKFYTDYSRKIFEDLVRAYPASTKLEDYKKRITDLRAKSLALAPAPAAGEKKDEGKD